MTSEASHLIKELSDLAQSEPVFEGDTGSRTRAVSLCKRIIHHLEDPLYAAMELRFFPTYTMAARIAIDLKIFERLAESSTTMTAAQLRDATGAEETLIARILRPLATLGFLLETSEGTWSASPITYAMSRPAVRAGHIHYWDQCLATQAQFPEYLRKTGFQQPRDSTNGPYQHILSTKQTAFEHWKSQDPWVMHNFNTFMTGSRVDRPSWLDWWPIRERLIEGSHADVPFLVDIGGGRGHDLQAFKKRFGNEANIGDLVLEDVEHVIDDIGEQDLDAGIIRIKHDFFQSQPVKGARAYFFHFIMHDWSDSSCINILSQIRSAMTKGYSKLIINDFILPDQNCPASLGGYDLTMMTIFAAKERTRKQWTKLIEGAGLKLLGLSTLNDQIEGIIEAELL